MGDMAELHYCYDEDSFIADEPEILNGIKIIHETDKAYFILHQNRKAWFPKSICVIEDDSIYYPYSFDVEWEALRISPKEIEGDFI